MPASDSNLGTLVEVDSRRRISLGQLGHHSRYLATVDSDGSIAHASRMLSDRSTDIRLFEFPRPVRGLL